MTHRAALLSLALVLPALSLPAASGDRPAPAASRDAWPAAVHARYRLRYNGIDVGHLEISSQADGKTYALSGNGKVSVLFGAITWSGSSTVTGSIADGTPAPSSYAFEWHNNKKGGTIRIGFRNHAAADISVAPPPDPHPDLVPLRPADKVGALDPVSAILMLTRADGRAPCDRRVGIFDGKQRYDIVLTYKRQVALAAGSGGSGETAVVCRAMYEPVAGHRANAATKTYASNSDVEVVMRRIPGSEMVIPYSVTVPTFWGTGSMVTERIDITTASARRIALTP